MTENEAIKILKNYIGTITAPNDSFTEAKNVAIQALVKIQQYREIENRLKEVYGECDGLLEIVVNSLLDYDRSPDKAIKAVLLTNEDVDKWEAIKEIGTVDEIKALKEKSLDIEKIVESIEQLPTKEFLGVLHIPRTATINRIKRGANCELPRV